MNKLVDRIGCLPPCSGMFNIQNIVKQWVGHFVQLTNKLDTYALIEYRRE